MKEHLDRIFGAENTTAAICEALQAGIDNLRQSGYLKQLSEFYENIAATTPEEVQGWFDDMANDPKVKEEGALKDVCELFQAALGRLRQAGFRRNTD